MKLPSESGSSFQYESTSSTKLNELRGSDQLGPNHVDSLQLSLILMVDFKT